MGWSCTRRASWVQETWSAFCISQTGVGNTYEANGKRYFYETSRTEHGDGAITGAIWRFLPDGKHVRRSGSFRIEGDGTIKKAPKCLKDVSPSQDDLDKREREIGRIAVGSNSPSFLVI